MLTHPLLPSPLLPMRVVSACVAGLLLASHAHAIKCSSDDTLKRYDISKSALSSSLERDTPPSVTNEQWFLQICEENADDKIGADCGSGDTLCGTTRVKLSGKDPLLTQVINYQKNVKYEVQQGENGFTLQLKGTKWGSGQYDARIEFHCSRGKDTDEMTFDRWQSSEVQLSVLGPSGCLKKDNDDDGGDDGGDNEDKKPPSKGSGSSWFTWLLLYAILFTLIYLTIISYANTRGGSFQDFKEEFLDRSKQLLTSLPEFVKEIASKLFGSSSSPRGGYSAV